ncbi:C-reactive protein-like [Xyrichtys novacula]|uniref:Pentraxin family member n=1 Tax=Xyrichtys novacula TaxID=13765 RepID=A0AAV1FLX4_XYRNO|nr:C-reactive protein-like [Xyrichtys novacula]
MALLLLLVMLTVCAALPQDMSGKMFTFPEESDTDYVRLTTSRQSLSTLTVCLRTFTDLNRDHTPFSLATPGVFNDFVIYRYAESNEFSMNVRDKAVRFRELDYKPNTWHSLCSTWDSVSGVLQVWLDGKPSSRKYISSGSNITGPMIIVLGQEQDSYGGGFDAKQSFVGMMSDVHMWDYTLSPCQIQRYTNRESFPSGNVLDWKASFQTFGRVLIEDQQGDCLL